MRGGEQDAITRGKEVAAGGAPLASAHEFRYGRLAIWRVHHHGVNLIARHVSALVLEDELFIIEGEIGLGVLAAKRKLPRIFQVLLFFRKKQRIRGLLLCVEGHIAWAREAQHREQSGHKCPSAIPFFHDIPCSSRGCARSPRVHYFLCSSL